MTRIGVALDLGTSGFRAQAVNLDTNQVLATAITARHPVPGANVMDHLNFAIEVGADITHVLVVEAVNQAIASLGVQRRDVDRLAVCGNPIQLSLFEGIEIRDLAYAGPRKRQLLGVTPPDRRAKIKSAGDIQGLAVREDARVIIPPAVKHEIGADALAMLVKSGMLERDGISLATDYGTNAEMALKVGEQIITGSCAAGPALEGQHIEDGMLAAPGAIADLKGEGIGWCCLVLDEQMMPRRGDVVSLRHGRTVEKGEYAATGITGTGVIALVHEGMAGGFIRLPRLATGGHLYLANGVRFSQKDLGEAGKAIGAIRAGYITLAHEAGIEVHEIVTAYMAGASGTYVDAHKAQAIGMVPPGVREIHQVGNTSLALARDMVLSPDLIWDLEELAGKLRTSHCMFGLSKTFERAYLLELALWGEGMPWAQYHRLAQAYRLPRLPDPVKEKAVVFRIAGRDIVDLGLRGLTIISPVGKELRGTVENCTSCRACVDECPEGALLIPETNGRQEIVLRPDLCIGIACRRCERACPVDGWKLPEFFRAATACHGTG